MSVSPVTRKTSITESNLETWDAMRSASFVSTFSVMIALTASCPYSMLSASSMSRVGAPAICLPSRRSSETDLRFRHRRRDLRAALPAERVVRRDLAPAGGARAHGRDLRAALAAERVVDRDARAAAWAGSRLDRGDIRGGRRGRGRRRGVRGGG